MTQANRLTVSPSGASEFMTVAYMSKRTLIPLWVAAALGLLVGLGTIATADEGDSRQLNANLTPDPWPIDPFTLVDHHGGAFTQERLHGQWTFVVFGYTRCAHTCAAALTTLADVANLLAPTRAAQNTQVLFVSVDPERDTTERLRDYVAGFSEGFIGASGSQATLKQLTDEMSVSYRLAEPATESNQVEPSASIQLIGPDSLLRAEFFPPYDAAALTAAYLKIRFCRR